MKFRFSGVFADAGAMWRSERDLLIRIAGVFLFLPTLAANFFLPLPDFSEADTREAMSDALLLWFGNYGGWFALQSVLMTLGSGVLLILLLDRQRPDLGEALWRGLKLLPVLLLAWTFALLLISLGSMLLLVVAFYIGGRLMMTGAVAVIEPERGPFGALIHSVRLSNRHGWMLSAVSVVVLGAGYAAALIPQATIGALEASGYAQPLLIGPLQMVSAAASAAGSLAMVLVQAAAYRLARQGI